MDKLNFKTPSGRLIFYLADIKYDDKKSLFFIHGFPDGPNIWQNQFSHFEDDYNIIAPYIINDGSHINKPNLNDLCRDYISLIKHHNLDDVIIVSHDLGGPIANELVDQLANIKKAIFINAVSIEQMRLRISDINQLKKSWYIFLFQNKHISRFIVKKIWNQINKKITNQNNIPFHSFEKGIFLQNIELYQTFFKHLISLKKEFLKKTKTPCVFIWSRYDPYLNIPSRTELELLFQNYSLELIDCHHWAMIENTSLINKTIERNL